MVLRIVRRHCVGEEVAGRKIVLDGEESRELHRRIKATTVAVRDRQRAEIIVLGAAGMSQGQIAARVGVSRVTVNHWCRRFLGKRLAGLEDAAGRGRKPSLPPDAVRMVLDKAVTPPTTLGRWSCRTMARQAGVSKATVQRLWAANDIKPHLTRHFHMHFTPTSSSWLNLVERFFRDLTDFITERSFASVGALSDAIIGFLAERNQNAKRYV
jgi:Homeodomain-like domain